MTGVVAIGSGLLQSIAIKNGATVYAWGDGGSGRLGDGNTSNQYSPVPVQLP
jgi:alpha-tubulin suppressor-like RCC1 family protein